MNAAEERWLRLFIWLTVVGLACGLATMFKVMHSDHDEMILIFGMIVGSILVTAVGVAGVIGSLVGAWVKKSRSSKK